MLEYSNIQVYASHMDYSVHEHLQCVIIKS